MICGISRLCPAYKFEQGLRVSHIGLTPTNAVGRRGRQPVGNVEPPRVRPVIVTCVIARDTVHQNHDVDVCIGACARQFKEIVNRCGFQVVIAIHVNHIGPRFNICFVQAPQRNIIHKCADVRDVGIAAEDEGQPDGGISQIGGQIEIHIVPRLLRARELPSIHIRAIRGCAPPKEIVVRFGFIPVIELEIRCRASAQIERAIHHPGIHIVGVIVILRINPIHAAIRHPGAPIRWRLGFEVIVIPIVFAIRGAVVIEHVPKPGWECAFKSLGHGSGPVIPIPLRRSRIDRLLVRVWGQGRQIEIRSPRIIRGGGLWLGLPAWNKRLSPCG